MLVNIKRSFKIGVGVLCVVLGFAALVTPLTPGSWLIPIGLELLGVRILLENKLWAWVWARPNSNAAWIIRKLLCLRLRIPGLRRKRKKMIDVAGSDASTMIRCPPDDADRIDRQDVDEFVDGSDRRGR